MTDIKEKFVRKLNQLDGQGRFTEADWDEVKVLHSYCEDQFTTNLNKVLKSYNYNSVTETQRNIIDRLLRIIKVEDSIPKDVRLNKPVNVLNENLIPVFSLDKEDKKRISELCEKMRKIIFQTDAFDEPHRLRLLNRIAAIEAEIHKPKGMFDVVRGGIDDLGETLGKFGKNIKPLTDRMSEVVGIARKATKAYDQLPAPEEIGQLPKPEDFEENQ